MPLPDLLPMAPFTRPARGDVNLPGSKSITNRALMLAGLGERPVALSRALSSDDTAVMAAALRKLGFSVSDGPAAGRMQIGGQENAFAVQAAPVDLFVGLAGTAARFLTALCAAAPRGTYRIAGVPRMHRRPMRGLLEALRSLGADIRPLGEDGFLPVEIRSRGLRADRVRIDAAESSQMLSALLMIAPKVARSAASAAPLSVEPAAPVRAPFVEMTVRMMRQFGVEARPQGRKFCVPVGFYRPAGDAYAVEPDATAAGYFLALPLIVGGALKLKGVVPASESLQGDIAFAGILEDAGLRVAAEPDGIAAAAARGTPASGLDRNFNAFSDTFLTFAAIAPLLEGRTRITGIAHTRKQETDRVRGMAAELRKLGQEVLEEEDALTIFPRPLREGQAVETYGDHRFAMSFAILGCRNLRGDGKPWLTIRDPGCCAKTFPNFFEVLDALREQSAESR
jgi:3-phosphoshikimate 1-carboxyvinyltransferase